MPFKSKAEARWGNSPSGLRALGGKDKVDEWNQSTNFDALPDKVEGILSKSLKRRPAAPKPAAGVLGKRFQPK